MANIRELNAEEKSIFTNAVYYSTQTFHPLRPVLSLLRVYYHSELTSPTGTDFKWRLYLSDSFFSEQLNVHQRAFLIVHEALHNLYRHEGRASSIEFAHQTVNVNGAPMKLFVLAGDLEINGFILRRREDKVLKGVGAHYNIDPSIALLPQNFNLPEDDNMEGYLEKLRDMLESDNTSGGVPSDNQGTANQNDFVTPTGGHCGYIDPMAGDNLNLEAPSPVSVNKATSDFRALAREEYSGIGNNSLNEIIGALDAVEGRTIHDYEKILRHANANHLRSKKRGQHRTNYRRIKRKDIYCNGILQPTRNRLSATYFLIIDGSSSMLNEYDMTNAARETQGFFELIQRQGGVVHVATGDTELGYVNKDVKDIANVILAGGGGTDMVPIINSAIEDYNAENIILISDMKVPVQGFDEIISENFKRQFLLISTDTMSSYPEPLINLEKIHRNLMLISARGI